jgi:hypothetical protein
VFSCAEAEAAQAALARASEGELDYLGGTVVDEPRHAIQVEVSITGNLATP